MSTSSAAKPTQSATAEAASSDATYVGNSLTVANGGADGEAPLVILSEYNSDGPLTGASPSTTFQSAGTVNDVKFYGGDYNFTVYALSRIGSVGTEQTFLVDTAEHFSGTALPGVHILPTAGFNVAAGELLAFAGIGPYYPQQANDTSGSDATYENGDGSTPFSATAPSGTGTEFTVAADVGGTADYAYIPDTFENQGRDYAIGVDVSPPTPAVTTNINALTDYAATEGGLTVIATRGDHAVDLDGAFETLTADGGTENVDARGWSETISTGIGCDTITLYSGANVINAGSGYNIITDNVGSNTFEVPAAGQGWDRIVGNSLANADVFDMRTAMAAAGWDGQMADLGNYLQAVPIATGSSLHINVHSGGTWTPVLTLWGQGGQTLAEFEQHATL